MSAAATPAMGYAVAATIFMMMMTVAVIVVSEADEDVVRIGALLAFNTSIGRAAQRAIEIAVQDVNNDPWILPKHRLHLTVLDSGCDPIQTTIAAINLLEKEVVAIVGPQSSLGSHFIAHMARATQVPILTFGVTDPALSEYAYPYFFRVSHRDTEQMVSVASFISHYGWKKVSAIYSNDEYGNNAIAALHDALLEKGSILADRVALGSGNNDDGNLLRNLSSTGQRVFVLHMPPSDGLRVLYQANALGLMGKDSVWIVTDMITLSLEMGNDLVGLIGTRAHILKTSDYVKRFGGNTYAFYAYDCVWMIVKAITSHWENRGTLEYESASRNIARGGGELSRLRKLKSGPRLRKEILATRFPGVSGMVELNERGDRKGSTFDFLNFVGSNASVIVGYWENGTFSHLSNASDNLWMQEESPLDMSVSSNNTTTASSSNAIVWPSGIREIPRGWVLPNMDRPLQIGVPRKAGYKELLNLTYDTEHHEYQFSGYCIEVFEAAVKHLSYSFPYKFIPFGNMSSTPEYDDLIKHLASKDYDAVVGDVLVTSNRLKIVDFTQPYIESGLVVLAPVKNIQGKVAWSFTKPFTLSMWLTTAAFFFFTGVVVWILEHRMNDRFRGHPWKQVVTMLWFILLTLFFAQDEEIKSDLGKLVLVIWLFFILIITSSYTASLTAMLTAQKLQPTVQDLQSLLTNNVAIGYQTGSFVRRYLMMLGVDQERLKPLNSQDSYYSALSRRDLKGGVAAIVDESAYVNMFLNAHPKGFAIADNHMLQNGGWAFAFPKDSPYTEDMSEAILIMSKNRELQTIHDKWFGHLKNNNNNNNNNNVSSSAGNANDNNDVLDLNSFWGLFLVSGMASLICLVIYIAWNFRQFWKRIADSPPPPPSWCPQCIVYAQEFIKFMDERTDNRKEAKPSPPTT